VSQSTPNLYIICYTNSHGPVASLPPQVSGPMNIYKEISQ